MSERVESAKYQKFLQQDLSSIDQLDINIEHEKICATIKKDGKDTTFLLASHFCGIHSPVPPDQNMIDEMKQEFWNSLQNALDGVSVIGILSVTMKRLAHISCADDSEKRTGLFQRAHRKAAVQFFDRICDSRQLIVRELSLKNLWLDEVLTVLHHVKPKSLKTIHLDVIAMCTSYYRGPQDFSKLFELEQWKQAKRISSTHTLFDWKDLQHFLHFQNVNVKYYGDFTKNRLEMLKEALLKNPTLCQFKINTTLDHYPNQVKIDEIRKSHGPGWVYFSYPTTGKLGLHLCYSHIWFRGPCYGGQDKDDREEEDEEEEEVQGSSTSMSEEVNDVEKQTPRGSRKRRSSASK